MTGTDFFLPGGFIFSSDISELSLSNKISSDIFLCFEDLELDFLSVSLSFSLFLSSPFLLLDFLISLSLCLKTNSSFSLVSLCILPWLPFCYNFHLKLSTQLRNGSTPEPNIFSRFVLELRK